MRLKELFEGKGKKPGDEYPDHESNKAFQILYAHLKKKDLLACQQDLIDAGLDEYAQL